MATEETTYTFKGVFCGELRIVANSLEEATAEARKTKRNSGWSLLGGDTPELVTFVKEQTKTVPDKGRCYFCEQWCLPEEMAQTAVPIKICIECHKKVAVKTADQMLKSIDRMRKALIG